MTSKGTEKITEFTIGVDISKDILDVYRLPDEKHRQFSNDPKGFRDLIAWLEDGQVERIVFEATGAYHRPFEIAMHKQGRPTCKLNPRHLKHFRMAVGELAKTDRLDAALLARYGLSLKPRVTTPPSQLMCDLKQLLNARQALIKQRTAIRNQQKNLTVALLQRQLKRNLKSIKAQLTDIDEAILQRIKGDTILAERYEILNSIPGIAKCAAFVLIVEMPELATRDNQTAASISGTAPRICQSGKRKGKAHVHGGRHNVRKALYMPALVATRFNPHMKAKYKDLTKRGKPPKVAIAAIMRKMIILANALLRDQRKWHHINT